MNEMKIDHLGIAVKSIAEARKFYEALGLAVTHEETVAHERVHTAMLPIGESRVELLEATDEQSAIAKFILKRGEGLHHIAVLTPDIHAAMRELKQRGVRLVNEQIQRGAGGHEYFFVHPSSAGGVLVELVQASKPDEHQ
jgi:methylmalonyl-CoA epimerase